MSNLALTMRPTQLSEVIGAEAPKRAIAKFLETGNIPNAFLFWGPSGTGKTTLAWIVARALQPEDSYILEINGSDKNGVDDARQIAENSLSCPFNGHKRVIIWDEVQRLTSAAQDCLLLPLERKESNTIWLFASTAPDKLIPALKSRCSAAMFELKPLNKTQISDLIYTAIPSGHDSAAAESAVKFGEWFYSRGITSPREILGVLDQHLAGVPLEQAVHGAEHEPLYKDVCGAVLRGDWAKTSSLLAQIKTADSRGLVSVLSSFLRGELIKNPIGPKADSLAACLVGVDSLGYADGTAYGATVGLMYKVCKALGGK